MRAVRARHVVDPLDAEDDAARCRSFAPQLNLDALVKTSRGEGYDAESASRSLALVRIQLSTIAREMRDRHDVRADVVQKVLDSIK